MLKLEASFFFPPLQKREEKISRYHSAILEKVPLPSAISLTERESAVCGMIPQPSHAS